MLNFKLWMENLFDDDFDAKSVLDKIKKRGKIIKQEEKIKNEKLKLYHGFNRDPSSFNYIFDSSKSEQGLLWFTHKFIRGYNPIDYAANRGKYVLIYDLPIKIIQNMATYENGETLTTRPEINIDYTVNNNKMLYYDSIIELPKNWFFTYKNEKFIGYSGIIHANSNIIFDSAFLLDTEKN